MQILIMGKMHVKEFSHVPPRIVRAVENLLIGCSEDESHIVYAEVDADYYNKRDPREE